MSIFDNVFFIESGTSLPKIIDKLKTPEDIFKYMRNNIKYDSSTNWKLKSLNQICISKKGNCHDQAYFISKALTHIGVKNSRIFFIEYNKNENTGGRTHTLTYFVIDKKVYWMETSWGGFEKIHGPFDNVSKLKKYIESIHSKEPQSKKYPLLQWGNPSKSKEGMNLQDYVDACLK